MFDWMTDEPGLLYVAATLIPLASFVLLLTLGCARFMGRRYNDSPLGASLYWLLGGDTPGPGGAYIATGAIALSCALSLIGLTRYLESHPVDFGPKHAHHDGHHHNGHAKKADDHHDDHKDGHSAKNGPSSADPWTGSVTWAKLSFKDRPAVEIKLGYYIDHLSAVMFAMVTFIATLIHLFALGYMAEERQEFVEDHQAHVTRRGRFNRFFLYFSLFCFSMLNLVLADNFFQVFVSWELVGICSFGLIGFYYERHSASTAANKAFITNRVGDAGFIIGLMIIWTNVGTFNFQEVFARLRCPTTDSHGDSAGDLAGKIVRANPVADKPGVLEAAKDGTEAVLFPLRPPGHYHPVAEYGAKVDTTKVPADKKSDPYGSMPYWMLTLAGVGVFLGCVGKSAQFPLQTWLPDAMEGPTPVSALVHSATMVAAGVYLVGRAFPLFTPEARLVIAYTGGITLFVAATIAIVSTDIKKVLAYSTVSQLGYMMLAIGIGGWVAGLLHLLTHAFFKALLFLGSGSVIHGCHHEQDMRKMGGLLGKMPVTAATMLVGVLAIMGFPLFSGWYSKDAIIAEALAFTLANPAHILLLILPVVTAAITTFYMFRMWFLTFTGEPRDQHVYDHCHESPWVMTIPLMVLAVFSVFVAAGNPPWDAEASMLGRVLTAAAPPAVEAEAHAVHEIAHQKFADYHSTAGIVALISATIGFVFAAVLFLSGDTDPTDDLAQYGGFAWFNRLLVNKWYFDDVYEHMVTRPALAAASWPKWFDANGIDGTLHATANCTVDTAKYTGRFDNGVIDGLVNLSASVIYHSGRSLRAVQTGSLRGYVLMLVLAATLLFFALAYYVGLAR